MLQKSQIENKIPDIANLATKAAQNTKATEVVSKILDRANLATRLLSKQKLKKLKEKHLIPKFLILLLSSQYSQKSILSRTGRRNENNCKQRLSRYCDKQ